MSLELDKSLEWHYCIKCYHIGTATKRTIDSLGTLGTRKCINCNARSCVQRGFSGTLPARMLNEIQRNKQRKPYRSSG